MIYITVELNKDIYIKIPKVKEGISPYNLTMTSQAGGQQMVFADLVDNSDKSSVYRFILNFTQYTPSGIYNYVLVDSADKVMSKGLIQVNMNNTDDYFYADDELGYFVDESESGDMSNYYTKSQVDSMLTQYEKKSDLPDFNNFVTEEELQQEVSRQIDEKHIITEEDLDQSVESYINSKDLVNSTQLTNTLEWYVTDAELQNMGYVTTLNLRQNYYNKPETEANFTSYAYLEERISRIPGGGISMDDVKNYVVSQSYITSDELSNTGYVTSNDLSNMGYITLNDIPAVDLSSYVTYTYLEEKLSEYQPSVDLSAYVTKTDLSNQSYITPSVLNACGYATVNQIPVVSNAGIVLRQGGVTKGTFNLNQSTGVTIDLDEGGQVDLSSYVTKSELVEQSYITLNDVPVYDLSSYITYTYLEETLAEYQPAIDLSSYVTKNDLVNQAYITSDYLANQAYITNTYLDDYVTYTYLEERLSDISIDLSSYVTKQELKDQSYVTKQFLTNRSYVTSQQLVDQSYITMADVSAQSYLTKQDMVNQSYITSQYLDNQSYVTQVQLTSNSYVTSSYMDSFFNNHTTALLFTMGNDTIKVITFYTQDEL